MYHWEVRRRMKSVFERLNAGDWQAMTNQLASNFEYRFIGDSALSGTRCTQGSMAMWWQRFFALFPTAKLEVRDIVSSGMPWNTKVMAYVTISDQIPTGKNGDLVDYSNEFMQLVQIKWGRVTSVLTLEDTVRLNSILETLVEAGREEAESPPIDDMNFQNSGTSFA